jgi:putative ABC transport system substrate-binding protein
MEAHSAGATLGLPIDILAASNIEELDAAFAHLAQRPPDALVISPNTLFNNRRVQIVTLASHQRLPTILSTRAEVEEGGLMSYGEIGGDSMRQVGLYTGRFLKGEKAGNAKFELVINLRTARALGISVPPTLLAVAGYRI